MRRCGKDNTRRLQRQWALEEPRTLWVLHENEEVYYAVVQGGRFGTGRWSYKLDGRFFGAGRFRLLDISDTSGLGREFDWLY
jgi:hypothetical protein